MLLCSEEFNFQINFQPKIILKLQNIKNDSKNLISLRLFQKWFSKHTLPTFCVLNVDFPPRFFLRLTKEKSIDDGKLFEGKWFTNRSPVCHVAPKRGLVEKFTKTCRRSYDSLSRFDSTADSQLPVIARRRAEHIRADRARGPTKCCAISCCCCWILSHGVLGSEQSRRSSPNQTWRY